ncbi:DUF5133 domain-containing protein [Streptomyces sp. NPDC055749]
MSTYAEQRSESGASPSPSATAPVGNPLLDEPPTPWAVGMIMAMTPCSRRDAKRILTAAAEAAHIAPTAMAAAMVAGSRGVPVPAHVERALRRAVEAARNPSPSPSDAARGVALVPSRQRTEQVLSEFRRCQALLAVTPSDRSARQALDDAAYTLCVLLGRTTVHDAVDAAEQHLAAST